MDLGISILLPCFEFHHLSLTAVENHRQGSSCFPIRVYDCAARIEGLNEIIYFCLSFDAFFIWIHSMAEAFICQAEQEHSLGKEILSKNSEGNELGQVAIANNSSEVATTTTTTTAYLSFQLVLLYCQNRIRDHRIQIEPRM